MVPKVMQMVLAMLDLTADIVPLIGDEHVVKRNEIITKGKALAAELKDYAASMTKGLN